uniref:Uncharacterized protein n=1 Tax=Periophthalmus magnuspinnatus TaxID=409849 RepID=A0A3B3ZFQ5_9GOBI
KMTTYQTVTVNNFVGSYHMELEGLKQSLSLFNTRCVTLDSIVTDRQKLSLVFFTYDFHCIVLRLIKKMMKIVQNNDCRILLTWLFAERVTKWTSILNHMHTPNTHPSDTSKWLKPGDYFIVFVITTTAFFRLSLKVLPILSWGCFTWQHYILITYRLQVASSSGQPMFRLFYLKFKKGDRTAKPIKMEATFSKYSWCLLLTKKNVFIEPSSFLEGVHPYTCTTVHSTPTVRQSNSCICLCVLFQFCSRAGLKPMYCPAVAGDTWTQCIYMNSICND